MTRPCWGQMQFSCVGRTHRGLHAAADNDLVLRNMASTHPFFSSSCEPWSFGLPQGRPLSLILRGSSFQKPVDLQYVPCMIARGFKVEGHKLMSTVFYCRIELLWVFHKLPSTSGLFNNLLTAEINLISSVCTKCKFFWHTVWILDADLFRLLPLLKARCFWLMVFSVAHTLCCLKGNVMQIQIFFFFFPTG